MGENASFRILYIVPYMEAAGTERHVLHLAQGLHRHCRLGLLSPEGPLLPEFQRLGIAHRPFPRLETDVQAGLRAFRRGLRELLRLLQPDLVHVHAGPELAVLVRTVNRRVPLVLTIHGFHGSHAEANYRLAGWLARLARVRRVIAVSQAEARLLETGGLRPPRLVVIPNGIPVPDDPPVDWRRELGWPGDAPVVGAVGRLEEPKGFDVLIEAFSRLTNEGGSVQGSNGRSEPSSPSSRALPRLVIVGDGSRREQLERQARELGLEERVHLAGFRSDARGAFAGFDVTVIPSRHEPQGIVCLEAMAAGSPVIASDTGGLPDMIQHGVNGWLVPPGDAAALARTLAEVLADPSEARKRGAAGRHRFFEEFLVDRMVQRTLAVYEEALGATKTRAGARR